VFRLPALNLFYVYQLLALGNINSCEILELGGRLDQARLRAALLAALGRHPVLNSRFRKRFWRSFYCEVAAEPLPIDLRVHSCPTDDEEAIHHALRANIWSEAIDVTAGRPVRFHLLETPTRSYLQIVTARLYNDAKAGYRLAHDIAESYSALESNTPFDSSPIQVPDRSTGTLFTGHFGLRQHLRHAFGALLCLLRDLFRRDAQMPTRAAPRGETDFVKVDLGADVLGGLRNLARARGVTVHALLALTIFKIWQATAARDAARPLLRILDNFSLRPFARVEVEDLYETLVVPYTIRVPTRASDTDIVASVSDQLKYWKSGEILSELYRIRLYSALGRISPIRLSAKLVAKFVAKTNLVVSNPGPVPYPIDRFGSVPVVDFFNFSALLPPSKVMFIFSTFRGVLRATVVYDRNAYPEGPQREVIVPLRAEAARLAAATTL